MRQKCLDNIRWLIFNSIFEKKPTDGTPFITGCKLALNSIKFQWRTATKIAKKKRNQQIVQSIRRRTAENDFQ